MILLIISLLSVVVFARPPSDTCCNNANDCVGYGMCISSNSYYWDLDGDNDKEYCFEKRWYDCGSNGYPSEGCSETNGRGWYCQSNDCSQRKIACASCNNNNDCVDAGGSCRSGSTETGGLCSDGLDNDCDGSIDCSDSDCVGDSACCGTWGADCCGSSPVCDGSMYCTPENHCCNPTQRWSGTQCVGTTQCYTADCPYLPFTTNWWTTNGCFLISTPQACCNVGTKYGFPNYYAYEDADGNINVETY